VDLDELARTAAGIMDIAGTGVIVLGAVAAVARYTAALARMRKRGPPPLEPIRGTLGRAILLGLEFLVAADIIRTVAVEPTLRSVAVLGVIVAIRTFLSFSLGIELTGELPWRRSQSPGGAADA
jgi:uncharacterized membrane protein